MKIQKIACVIFFFSFGTISAMWRLNSKLLQPVHGYLVRCVPLSSQNRKEMNNAIEQELLSAKKSVRIAMYSFTRRQLAYVLAYLQNEKNIKVQVILDRNSTNGTFNMNEFLKKLGIKPLVYSFADKSMHHKLSVIDENRVIKGSYNFSDAAAERNCEDVDILYGKKVAQKYNNVIDGIVAEINHHKRRDNQTQKMLRKQWQNRMVAYERVVALLNKNKKGG